MRAHMSSWVGSVSGVALVLGGCAADTGQGEHTPVSVEAEPEALTVGLDEAFVVDFSAGGARFAAQSFVGEDEVAAGVAHIELPTGTVTAGIRIDFATGAGRLVGRGIYTRAHFEACRAVTTPLEELVPGVLEERGKLMAGGLLSWLCSPKNVVEPLDFGTIDRVGRVETADGRPAIDHGAAPVLVTDGDVAGTGAYWNGDDGLYCVGPPVYYWGQYDDPSMHSYWMQAKNWGNCDGQCGYDCWSWTLHRWSLDCLEHDHCAYAHGGDAFGPCADEFWDASWDYFAACYRLP